MTTYDIITKLVYKAVATGFAVYNLAKGNTEKMLLWFAISIAIDF